MSTMRARSSFATRASLGDRSGRGADAARDWLAAAFAQLLAWHGRARQRRELELLNEHLLRDIGLSRADVDDEVSKPFWRA